jgi:hypothetical protein
LGENDTLTFYYDRQTAAEYAIAQSYANNTQDFTTIAQNDDSERADGSSTGIISVHLSDIPFAYMPLDLANGGTFSAMFTSSAIWMGGFPMVNDMTPSTCLGSNNGADAGWRYCYPDLWASFMWRSHENLLGYYIDGQTQIPLDGLADQTANPTASLPSNGVITTTGGGQIPNTSGNNGGWGFSWKEDLDGLISFITQGEIAINMIPALGNWAKTQLGLLRQGDYTYINSAKPDTDPDAGIDNSTPSHGFIVVGWGPIQNCIDSIGNTFSPTSFYPDASSAPANYVPYLVDFSGTSQKRVQHPVPRPFYCSRYDDNPNSSTEQPFVAQSDPFNGVAYVHGWFFFQLPDVVSIKASQLYQSQNWQWQATYGRP